MPRSHRNEDILYARRDWVPGWTYPPTRCTCDIVQPCPACQKEPRPARPPLPPYVPLPAHYSRRERRIHYQKWYRQRHRVRLRRQQRIRNKARRAQLHAYYLAHIVQRQAYMANYRKKRKEEKARAA